MNHCGLGQEDCEAVDTMMFLSMYNMLIPWLAKPHVIRQHVPLIIAFSPPRSIPPLKEIS